MAYVRYASAATASIEPDQQIGAHTLSQPTT